MALGGLIVFRGQDEPRYEVFGMGQVRSIGSGSSIEPLLDGLQLAMGDPNQVISMMGTEVSHPGTGLVLIGDQISHIIAEELQKPQAHPGAATVNHQVILGTLNERPGRIESVPPRPDRPPFLSIAVGREEYEARAPKYQGEGRA